MEHHRGRTRYVGGYGKLKPDSMDPRMTRVRKNPAEPGAADVVREAIRKRAAKEAKRAEAHLRSLLGYNPAQPADQLPAAAQTELERLGVAR